MKKKSIVIVVIGIILVAVVVVAIYMINRPEMLGNMNNNYSYSEPSTTTSNISFSLEAGDRIKFSFRSDIKRGELDIILYDSNGNAVYELAGAKALETFFTLDRSDTYTLAAESSDFVGKYKINVYKMD